MKELITFLLGLAPISEVRGAIPFGMSAGLSLKTTLFWSILGNIAPIIPLLLFLDITSKWLMAHSRFFKKFFEWLFARTRRHSDMVERFEAIGLMIFVGIPLPMTGAWSGCVAAFLFGVRFWPALIAISLGVLLAAGIVTAVVLGLVNVGSLAGSIIK